MKSIKLHAVPIIFPLQKRPNLVYTYHKDPMGDDWIDILKGAEAQNVFAKGYSWTRPLSLEEILSIANPDEECFDERLGNIIFEVAQDYMHSDKDPLRDKRIRGMKEEFEQNYEDNFEEVVLVMLSEAIKEVERV